MSRIVIVVLIYHSHKPIDFLYPHFYLQAVQMQVQLANGVSINLLGS
jgi:hypothetical protein